jgi:NADH-quinone oxidoreductase subunit C
MTPRTLAALFEDMQLHRLERCSLENTGLVHSCYLASEHLRAAAKILLEQEFHLEDVSMLEVLEGYLVVYHFDHFDQPGRIALRVLVDAEVAAVPTISDIFQGASWHERECRDFFGVSFTGHENMSPLLLSEEDVAFHPLQKDVRCLQSLVEIAQPGEVLTQCKNFNLFAPLETLCESGETISDQPQEHEMTNTKSGGEP